MRFLQVLAFLWGSTLGLAQNRLSNTNEIYDLVKTSGAIHSSFLGQNLAHVRIAIIDYGFQGFERYGQELGRTVRVVNAGQSQSAEKHGFAMAQIFMAASGALFLPESQRPEVLLISADGYSEFASAIDYCLGDQTRPPVDIVIHSRNFPWGSDFIGGGFFNAQVARATKAGITWINSAGNYGNSAYFGQSVKTNQRGEVELPGPGNALVFENRFDDQSFDITLTWNDFRSDVDFATRKDLDFAVFAEGAKQPLPEGIANKQQLGKQPKQAGSKISGNAFESLSLRLPERGKYYVKIYNRSKNFGTRDQFRLQIVASNPESLNFVSKNRTNEITAPADRSDVIAVGVASPFSSIQLNGDSLVKPDVILDFGKPEFQFLYSDSFSTGLDTSSAAAVMGGILANLRATDPHFSSQKILTYMHSLSRQTNGRGPLWVGPVVQSFYHSNAQMRTETPPAIEIQPRTFRPIHGR